MTWDRNARRIFFAAALFVPIELSIASASAAPHSAIGAGAAIKVNAASNGVVVLARHRHNRRHHRHHRRYRAYLPFVPFVVLGHHSHGWHGFGGFGHGYHGYHGHHGHHGHH